MIVNVSACYVVQQWGRCCSPMPFYPVFVLNSFLHIKKHWAHLLGRSLMWSLLCFLSKKFPLFQILGWRCWAIHVHDLAKCKSFTYILRALSNNMDNNNKQNSYYFLFFLLFSTTALFFTGNTNSLRASQLKEQSDRRGEYSHLWGVGHDCVVWVNGVTDINMWDRPALFTVVRDVWRANKDASLKTLH